MITESIQFIAHLIFLLLVDFNYFEPIKMVDFFYFSFSTDSCTFPSEQLQEIEK